MSQLKQYIWLFGENEGKTHNNNSFYFWDHIISKNDDVKKFLILLKNKKNKKFFKSLSKANRKFIIWKNSLKHWFYLFNYDLGLVTFSYKDIYPNRFFFFKKSKAVAKPIIYLQHGTIAMKKLGYKGNSYKNNLFRFFIYNKNIENKLIKENDFKKYQLYYASYHPRYKELIKRNDNKEPNSKKKILWFLTWREYFGKNKQTEKFLKTVSQVIGSKTLMKHLKKNNIELNICLHPFFDKKETKLFNSKIKNVNVFHPDDIDLMDQIIENDVLITDYSSLGFDFTTLKKPVILFQPDLKEYTKNRSFYCEISELIKNNVMTYKDLIDVIVNSKYKINSFFSKNIKPIKNYEYIKNGNHIDDMYNYLLNIQKKKITFIGYNFYGRGGTVSATKALAEGLLEKGFMVTLLSLKKVSSSIFAYGLNTITFYTSSKFKLKEILKRKLPFFIKNNYLKKDINSRYLHNFIAFRLRKMLKSIKSNTVVSTRESIHPFLNEAISNHIKNKVYFFHTQPEFIEKEFKGLIEDLKKINYEIAAFVTKTTKERIDENLKYCNSKKNIIVGNSLEGNMVIPLSEIVSPVKKNKYKGVILTRISNDRKLDLQKIIDFGLFLKKTNNKKIIIDVFGAGNYSQKFTELLKKNKLSKTIKYKGLTTDPNFEIKNHDFLLDLAEHQTFGMIYLEAIFNGKPLFATLNDGSKEVLKDFKECIFNDYNDLIEKIQNIHLITKKEIIRRYIALEKRYSREKVADKFLSGINLEDK